MACQSVQAPSHTVIHTALRRLCQQAWPNWAQLLSLHLQRVQGWNPWVLWGQVEGGEAGNGRLTRPGERKKRREGKGFQDLCPGLLAALGVTQLRLGSPDHKPPGKRGTEKGEEGVLEHWDFGGSQCYQYLQRKAPSPVPPPSPFPQKWPLRATEEALSPPHSCT